MVPIPDFLKDEITIDIEDNLSRGGGIVASITFKTKKLFASDRPGKVVPPNIVGIASTAVTATNREEFDRKLKFLFSDLYYFYFCQPRKPGTQTAKDIALLIEPRPGYGNERISIATTAHCTEWREATGDLKCPFRATVLFEVEDHPLLGKAEALNTYPAYSERGLKTLMELAYTWGVRKENWAAIGATRRPHSESFGTYAREVFMIVRRRDLAEKLNR